MTVLYSNPVFLDHDTGSYHPESPERLRAVARRLDASGLAGKCVRGVYAPIAVAELEALHDPSQVEAVRALAERGGGALDADTVLSSQSYEAALMAAGACTAAVDAVIAEKENPTALCLVRPPGHHATAHRSMGFCLFNNVALAAAHARRKHGLSRVLIVDWDVHHGNGTQDIFYEDPETFYLSIHRYPFYPGTGAADETGAGPGLGFTRNLPIRSGTSRKDYLACFESGLFAAAEKMKPEIVLISAGFDAHARDPIGSLGLEVEDFAVMTAMVRNVAGMTASGRIVSALEGGYDVEALAESVEAHLIELMGSRV